MYSQVTNRAKMSKVAPKAIHHHFSRIANRYCELRTTDAEPIAFVAKELRELLHVEAADIGCGDGGYDLLLCKYLGDKVRLACVDANDNMLKALDTYLKVHGISNFMAMNSRAEILPFPSGTLDCVFSFNAVHHFNLLGFLQESARILKAAVMSSSTPGCKSKTRGTSGGGISPNSAAKRPVSTLSTLSCKRWKGFRVCGFNRLNTLNTSESPPWSSLGNGPGPTIILLFGCIQRKNWRRQ